MKLFKCREKKTGYYLHFDDVILVTSSETLFLYLMEEANKNIRIGGAMPFFADDYEFEEMEASND